MQSARPTIKGNLSLKPSYNKEDDLFFVARENNLLKAARSENLKILNPQE